VEPVFPKRPEAKEEKKKRRKGTGNFVYGRETHVEIRVSFHRKEGEGVFAFEFKKGTIGTGKDVTSISGRKKEEGGEGPVRIDQRYERYTGVKKNLISTRYMGRKKKKREKKLIGGQERGRENEALSSILREAIISIPPPWWSEKKGKGRDDLSERPQVKQKRTASPNSKGEKKRRDAFHERRKGKHGWANEKGKKNFSCSIDDHEEEKGGGKGASNMLPIQVRKHRIAPGGQKILQRGREGRLQLSARRSQLQKKRGGFHVDEGERGGDS